MFRVSMVTDDGYYEDMYPEEEARPDYMARANTVVIADLLGNDPGVDDDLALEEAEDFTRRHPVTRATFLNPAFQSVSLLC